jgi:phage shock protein PspC (stress-responsive transcriptional regulator)
MAAPTPPLPPPGAPPPPPPFRPGGGFTLPEGLVRRRDERVLAGVCAGVARWIGVDPIFVRIAAVLLTFANGVAIPIYIVGWAMLPEVDAAEAAADPALVRALERGRQQRGVERAVALACLTLGVLLLVRWASPVFPDHIVWPATVGAAGLGVVWARAGADERARWREAVGRLPGDPLAIFAGRGMWPRVVLGAVLLISGFAWFFASNPTVRGFGAVVLGMLATASGIGLLLGPWIVGLMRQLRREGTERIRA